VDLTYQLLADYFKRGEEEMIKPRKQEITVICHPRDLPFYKQLFADLIVTSEKVDEDETESPETNQ